MISMISYIIKADVTTSVNLFDDTIIISAPHKPVLSHHQASYKPVDKLLTNVNIAKKNLDSDSS
jgi:hypothetical protein